MSTTITTNSNTITDEQNHSRSDRIQNEGERKRRPRNRKPREGQAGNDVENGGPSAPGEVTDGERSNTRGRGGRRWQHGRERQPGAASGEQQDRDNEGANTSSRSGRSSPATGRGGGRRPQGRRPPRDDDANAAPQPSSTNRQPTQSGRGGRRRQIGTALTETEPGSTQRQEQHHQRIRKPDAKSDGLTSRLTHSLSVPPYADCPICFNAIHPDQPIWSCQPGPSNGKFFH